MLPSKRVISKATRTETKLARVDAQATNCLETSKMSLPRISFVQRIQAIVLSIKQSSRTLQ